MSQDRGEQAFGIRTGQGVGVRVADSGRLDLDENLALARPLEVHLFDDQGSVGLECNGSAGLHGGLLPDQDAADEQAHRDGGP